MTRKKVELAFITDPSKRRQTFKKRKTGLMKKMSEISILCGIQACAIIYNPDGPNQPEVWPSVSGVQSTITRFRSTSEQEKSKKMFCQQSFLRQNIIKGNEQLRKLRSENRKKGVDLLIAQFLSSMDNLDKASIVDLNDISFMTEQKLEEIRRRKAQMVTPPVAENGGQTLTQGEQAQENHVQELDTNVDATQNLNWSMDFINAGGANEILAPEEVNVQSGWLNQYISWEK